MARFPPLESHKLMETVWNGNGIEMTVIGFFERMALKVDRFIARFDQ
jgi:hypothetical protein